MDNEELTQDDQPAVNLASQELLTVYSGLSRLSGADATSGSTLVTGDSALTAQSGNAKTGKSTPIALAAALGTLAGAAAILLKKHR